MSSLLDTRDFDVTRDFARYSLADDLGLDLIVVTMAAALALFCYSRHVDGSVDSTAENDTVVGPTV